MNKFYFKPIALNQCTCKNLSILDFFEFASKGNFDGIELNYQMIKKELSEKSELNINKIAQIFKSYTLQISSIFPLENFSLSSDGIYKTEILKNFQIIIEYCSKLESDLIIIKPSSFQKDQVELNIPKWRILNKTRKRIEDVAKKANKEDIKVGFDCLFENSSITTLKEAKELLKTLESYDNIGYIIDSYYFAKNGLDITQIADFKNYIYIIRLADIILNEKNNPSRLFPGTGNFNFLNLYNFANKIRYKGSFSIELSAQACDNNLLENFSILFKARDHLI